MDVLKRVLPSFLVTLFVIVGCKSNVYKFESLPDTVKSYFTITSTKFNINTAIQFSNESENASNYLWDFGDGTQSSEKNPGKVYTHPGIYSIALRATGEGGTGNYSTDVTVIDPDAVTETDKELYFIEYGNSLIRKISLMPGSTSEVVANMAGKEGHGMTYDAINKKIYYCDFQESSAGKVWRMNIDGSGLEELLSGLGTPYGIAVNLSEGKMYIADGAYISRASLDGSDYKKDFIQISDGAIRAVGFDNRSNQIYFYEVNDENLYIAKSDGTGMTPIIEGAYGYGIYIDEENNKLYYDDRNEGGLMQSNLNGSEKVKIAEFSGNRGGSGITVDHTANKVYWAETNNGSVKRANFDGSEVETIMSNVSNPRGMFIK